MDQQSGTPEDLSSRTDTPETVGSTERTSYGTSPTEQLPVPSFTTPSPTAPGPTGTGETSWPQTLLSPPAAPAEARSTASAPPMLSSPPQPLMSPQSSSKSQPEPQPQSRPQAPRQPAGDILRPDEVAWSQGTLRTVSQAFNTKVVGQGRLQETLLIGLLTGGHILLESVPGLAKTTAASTLAHAVTGSFKRIQCTPDLLPSDIVGTQIFDVAKATFETQLGPVHANFVLLDEINRSSAKTQSAMLEAMQERQTSIGGKAYPLPEPFLVLATQNPIEQEGTYVLPEAQLDRFMLKDVLDYPTLEEEAEVLYRIDAGVFTNNQTAVIELEDVRRLQRLTRRVYVDPAIVRYAVGIVYVTRHAERYIDPAVARYIEFGASPRGSIAFTQAARARALLAGRDHVVPDDIKALAHRVLRHRVVLGFEAIAENVQVESVVDALVATVRTP